MKARRTGLVVSAVIAVTAIAAIIFQNPIHDWWVLRGYNPTPEVAQLASDTTLVDSSRRLFYVNKPVIADNETFNEHCRDNEYTIVLGCYLPGQRGIYLLDVDDERLAGIMEVTAAHELLHAAYERLSSGDRRTIDALLDEVFENLDNTRIRETIELYRKQNPGIVNNELHSIIGTEVRDLPVELEEYYSRYFMDRLVIVGFSERYEQAFVERRNAIRQYDVELASLKKDIETLSTELNQREEGLRSMRRQMEQLRDSNQASAYNDMVPIYNSRVNSFNRDVDRLSAMVVRYNAIVQERNSIAAEEAELVDAIDSRDVVPEQQ